MDRRQGQWGKEQAGPWQGSQRAQVCITGTQPAQEKLPSIVGEVTLGKGQGKARAVGDLQYHEARQLRVMRPWAHSKWSESNLAGLGSRAHWLQALAAGEGQGEPGENPGSQVAVLMGLHLLSPTPDQGQEGLPGQRQHTGPGPSTQSFHTPSPQSPGQSPTQAQDGDI